MYTAHGTRPRPGQPGGTIDADATLAAETLRRAGGALPVERLDEAVARGEAPRAEPLARCLRRRDDLFLLVDRPTIPWGDAADGWTPADRSEYERGRRRDEAVVLLDGITGEASVRAPAVLRESLLSIWRETPGDELVRRELGRLADGA